MNENEIMQEVVENENAISIETEDQISVDNIEEEILPEDIVDGGSEPDVTEEAEKAKDESEELRVEVERLRAIIDEREREMTRMLSQIGEFSEVFPEKKLEDIPGDVWRSVKEGIPLAAAYALYEKKATLHTALAEKVNKRNAELSAGAVGKEQTSVYYSPAEVRKMTPREVKQNYNIIIESMKKWN